MHHVTFRDKDECYGMNRNKLIRKFMFVFQCSEGCQSWQRALESNCQILCVSIIRVNDGHVAMIKHMLSKY
jgi:hypothetical protein